MSVSVCGLSDRCVISVGVLSYYHIVWSQNSHVSDKPEQSQEGRLADAHTIYT